MGVLFGLSILTSNWNTLKDLAVICNGVKALGLNKVYDYETDSFQILLPLIASLTVHGRSHSLSLSKTTACLYKKDFM